VISLACGGEPAADSGASSTSEGEASGAADGEGDGEDGGSSGDTTSTGTSAGDGGFVQIDMSVNAMCSPTAQDCAEGEKCTAYSTDGDGPPSMPWDANKCVDETGNLQPGDSCDIVGGKYTGIDDCAAGSQCLLTDDLGMGGACVEFCNEQMACDNPNAVCSVYNSGSLPLCLLRCDPLIQDCPTGQGCYQGPALDFICFKSSADPGMGGPGSECAYVNSCQPGNVCLAPEAVEGCDPSFAGCCSPICTVGGMNTCQSTEQCIAAFDPPVPPDYEDVGFCAIPQ
jgi:hypothetical protein